FGRNSLRNRLRAFKLRAGIEKTALLAAVQFKSALGTLPLWIESRRQNSATVGTSRSRHCSNHPRRPRPELIRRTRPTLRRLPVMISFFSVVLFRIAITAMAILTIHKRLHPPILADGYKNLR